jgi:uncharacterized protein
MKTSRYNFLYNVEYKTHLLFNSLTGALAEIEPNDYKLVCNILSHPDNSYADDKKSCQLKEDLCKGGYLVSDTCDEQRLVVSRYRLKRYDPDPLMLVIAPTLNCNFRCRYCYEQREAGVMDQHIQEALVDFVESRIRRVKLLYVIWYGGEPLLYPKVILNLNHRFHKMCQNNQVQYIAAMITNGYLFTAEMAHHLVSSGLRWIQVTLDGPPSIHDRRRILANGKGTFNTIIQNVKTISDIVPDIIVRINVDKENIDSTHELIDLLDREGIKTKLKTIYVKPTGPSSHSCIACDDNCLHSAEDLAKYESLEQSIRRRLPSLSDYLRPREVNCLATRRNGFVVDPNGNLYKCLNSITNRNEQVGTIFKGGLKLEGEFLKWLSWDPFEDLQCRECKALPLCLGGCPLIYLREEHEFDRSCNPEVKLKEEILFRYRHLRANIDR